MIIGTRNIYYKSTRQFCYLLLKVTFFLVEYVNLNQEHVSKKPNAYVEIVVDKKHTRKTESVKGDHNPRWNETLTM